MYLVMNIGCMECGVSSNVVGVFADKDYAQKIATLCADKYNWREGGENSFEVFALPEAEQIDMEYEINPCEVP